MEFTAIALIIGGALWIAWRVWAKKRAAKKTVLEKAWHIVLEDPDYPHRREYEERMRDYEERARKEPDGP